MLALLPETTCCSPSGLLLCSLSSTSFSWFPSLHPAFLSFQKHRQWDPGCSQPRGPSSRLSLFTVMPKGSRVNPTTWHASVPAKGMPMSASIAALFICSLLSLFYTVCFYDYLFLSAALSHISWLFRRFLVSRSFSALLSVDYLIYTRCPTLLERGHILIMFQSNIMALGQAADRSSTRHRWVRAAHV